MNQPPSRSNNHNNLMMTGHHPVTDASSVKSDHNNDSNLQVLKNELKDAEHDILDLLKQLKKVNEQNLILTKRNQKLEYKVIKLKSENRHLRLEQASSNKRGKHVQTTTTTPSIVQEEATTATGSTAITKRQSYPESTTTVTSSSVVEPADDSIKYSEDSGVVTQSSALSQDLLMYSNEGMKVKQKAHSSKKKKSSSKKSPLVVSSEEVKKVRHHHHHHHHHRNRTGTEVQGTKSQNIAEQDHKNYTTTEKIEMNQSISSEEEEHSSELKLSFHKGATGGSVFHDQHNIDNHPLYIKYNKHSSKKKHIPAGSSDEDSDNLGFAKLSIFKDNITKTKTNKEISSTSKNKKGTAHHFKKRRSISQPRKSLRRACLSSSADAEDYDIYSTMKNSSSTRTVHKASLANNKQEETTKLFKSTGDVIVATTPVVLSPLQHRPVQRKGTPTLSRYHPLRRGSFNNNAEGSSVLTSSLLSRAASDDCNNNDDESIDKSLLLLSFDDLRSSFKESQAKLNSATTRYNPR